MEHEARNRGLHIHHQMCSHRRERVIASYHVDGFCLKRNTVLPMAWMSKVLSRKATENDHFCKEETRKERVDKRDAVCMNAEKKKPILEVGFELVVCREHNFHTMPIYLKKKR